MGKARILTTHAGSLVRPPEIVEARIRAKLGEPIPYATEESELRAAVRNVVKKQAEIGLDIIDDGEFGKVNWIAYLAERLDGFETFPIEAHMKRGSASVWPEQERFDDFYRMYERSETLQWMPDTPSKPRFDHKNTEEYVNLVCTGPLKYKPQGLQRDIDNLKAALTGVNIEAAFMPAVAPASIEMSSNKYYKTRDDYLFALADVLAVEYRLIIESGLLLQIDDAVLAQQAWLQFNGRRDEYFKWAKVRVEAINHALKGLPSERVRYHICYGSHNQPHTTDLALKELVDLMLSVNARWYSIEGANPRHEHEWKLWEDVKLPQGKGLIPGVVSHATNIVEHPELIAMRLENYIRLVGAENVIAGTDCGFSQSWCSARVHSQVQWAKLEALVEGTRLASSKL